MLDSHSGYAQVGHMCSKTSWSHTLGMLMLETCVQKHAGFTQWARPGKKHVFKNQLESHPPNRYLGLGHESCHHVFGEVVIGQEDQGCLVCLFGQYRY